MTENDKKLIEEAKDIWLDHEAIARMIFKADTEEAREILDGLERSAFIRCERAHFDTI